MKSQKAPEEATARQVQTAFNGGSGGHLRARQQRARQGERFTCIQVVPGEAQPVGAPCGGGGSSLWEWGAAPCGGGGAFTSHLQ